MFSNELKMFRRLGFRHVRPSVFDHSAEYRLVFRFICADVSLM